MNRAFHLILMPTEACNFRCVYCYEEFAHGRMRPEVIRGVMNLIARRAPELDHLAISWFGGEPLLARDVIEKVMLHARDLAARRSDLMVASNITTNAYLLTRECFERLLDWGVCRFQITFDGPREHHDRKRLLASGKGTFDRIWSNVLALREVERPFEVVIRAHVDRDNADDAPAFVDLYREALGADGRFRIFIRPLSRLGGPRDHALPILEGETAGPILDALRSRTGGGREHAADAVSGNPALGICYASQPNSFVVRADGRLNKCTVALEHPHNQIGSLHEDGTMQIHAPRMVPWIRGILSGSPRELRCPMLGHAETVTTPRSSLP